MQDNVLQRFRSLLLKQQAELTELVATGHAAAQTVELDQTRQGRLSRMDALQGQAMSRALNQRRELELRKIVAALRRIESGDYGYCINCDEEIAIKRLELDPAVSLCIDCASKAESV